MTNKLCILRCCYFIGSTGVTYLAEIQSENRMKNILYLREINVWMARGKWCKKVFKKHARFSIHDSVYAIGI